jgi:Transposase Tn5 dimerisation domain
MKMGAECGIKGLGPLHSETHRGFLLHPILAITPERVCLGALSNTMWVRERIGNKGLNRDRPIEEKESIRWLKGFELAEAAAKASPDTLIVSMTDREGDIYEFFQLTEGIRETSGAHWLIRSHYNRVTSKKEHGLNQGLWDVVRKREAVAQIQFELPKRTDPKTRQVTQEIRFARVKLGGSRRKGKGLKPLTVTAVLATEINVPSGEKPLEWLLISSLPVTDSEGAVTLLNWYLCRWEIELFFKILKSGCRIEQLQLEHVDRLFKCVTLYMIIAWRIMYIRSMGLKYPNQNCLVVFSESEWKAVYSRLHKNKTIPDQPISLSDMVILVARLGGFLARKRDGYPGIQTLWKGLQRMHDYAEAWECFREK